VAPYYGIIFRYKATNIKDYSCILPGTLLKEQGSFNLKQSMGHKGSVLRPRCIGPGRV